MERRGHDLKIKKPVIGITSSAFIYAGQESVIIHSSYGDSISRAGGVPIIFPIADEEMAKQWVGLCDGIVLSGGEDLDPHWYNEEPHPKL
jgi:putative glutamine amidotransferase